MRNAKNNDLADRRSAAAGAKAAALKAYRATRESAEPTLAIRQEEFLAIATARDERRAERDRIKLEALTRQQEQDRVDAEAAQQEAAMNAAAAAEIEARQKSDNMIARVIQDEAARKAERDRRYANRKAKRH